MLSDFKKIYEVQFGAIIHTMNLSNFMIVYNED